jgi:hypothetical protein
VNRYLGWLVMIGGLLIALGGWYGQFVPMFYTGIAVFTVGLVIWVTVGVFGHDEADAEYGECPTCKERIRVGAEKCRYCGEKVEWVEK